MDLWAEAIALDRLFSGTIQQGASIGNASQLQLRNPAGSSRHFFIIGLDINATLATSARIGRHDTALGTNVTTFGNMALGFGSGSEADLNRAAGAAILTTNYIREVDVDLNTETRTIDPRFPFHLAPGIGLLNRGHHPKHRSRCQLHMDRNERVET